VILWSCICTLFFSFRNLDPVLKDLRSFVKGINTYLLIVGMGGFSPRTEVQS